LGKVKPKVKSIGTSLSKPGGAATARVKNSRLSANPRWGTANSASSEVLKTAVSVMRGVEASDTVIDPSVDNLKTPGSVTEIPIAMLKNVTNTFVDSMLSLLMKSLTSCSGRGFMEFTFVRMVKEYGFVRALEWAESAGIPHEHSVELMNGILWGPRTAQIHASKSASSQT
jgi:hypothetical protein